MTVARLLLAGLAVSLATVAAGQEAHLEFAGKPRLIDCDGQPCFRLAVSAVDARGQATSIDDRATFRIARNDDEVRLIHRGAARIGPRAGTAPAASRARRVWLVLFDTSGSMNQRLGASSSDTKYAVARRQLERLLSSFQDGVDEMAIAPFDSQRVGERIRQAPFETTRAAIIRQMDGLQPRRQGNTALFSAIAEGLQKVRPYASGDAQVSVVLFTDGKNDVGHAGDDPGLLSGESGLRTVAALAGEVGVTIYAIGYGSLGTEFDEVTLQALKYPVASSNYFSVNDESRLTQVFENIVRRDAQLVTLLVGPLDVRREQLSGESVVFTVTTDQLSGETPGWLGNPLAAPAFEGQMTRAERETWVRDTVNTGGGILGAVWFRLAVVAIYSALLGLLWFVAPRFIWPDRYIPKPAMRVGAARPPGRPARPGTAPSLARGAPGSPRTPQSRATDGTVQVARSGVERRGDVPPESARPVREPSAAPPRPRDWGGRDAGDATVFIPPGKKPGNH